MKKIYKKIKDSIKNSILVKFLPYWLDETIRSKEGLKKFEEYLKKFNDINNLSNYEKYKKDFDKFKLLSKKSKRNFSLDWENRYACLADNTIETGFDHHYIYHPAWAARIIAENKPDFHVDISSTLNFCAILSAFVPVKFYDYRVAKLNLSNLSSENADLLKLPFEKESINSLSCMHTLEHIGLGRYGDAVDPDGDIKAINELKRVLSKNGKLLIAVPIGTEKIIFNAHRIYSYDNFLSYFQDLKLERFDLISDKENIGIIYNATKEDADMQEYGCGCFCFVKE